MKSKLVLALACCCPTGWAQTGAAGDAAGPAPRAGEPNVRRIVIEDDGAKIDELRVRGVTRRVVVMPKIGTSRRYEILVGPGGLVNAPEGTGGAQGAAGKRVWNVLDF